MNAQYECWKSVRADIQKIRNAIDASDSKNYRRVLTDLLGCTSPIEFRNTNHEAIPENVLGQIGGRSLILHDGGPNDANPEETNVYYIIGD